MVFADAPIAYLTCELKGRDLLSRMLIASHILEAGYPVILGQQWAMWKNIANAPKGCFLFKSTNMTQGEAMQRCKEGGHIVVAADEECLASARMDMARSTHPSAVRYCDVFLALNEHHRGALIDLYPELKPKIVVAGNARVDALRMSAPPRPRERDYVLINTSFGIINSTWGDRQAAAAVWINSGGHTQASDTIAMVRERISFEENALKETKALIEWLIAETTLDVVIRPHPQERPEMWSDSYPVNRVTVVVGSDPGPWIRHSMLAIHSESTTGVEAAIMGVKSLNLSPASGWSSRLIVSEVNPTAATASGAVDMIRSLLNDGEWPPTSANLNELFRSGGAKNTADAIVSTLPAPERLGAMKWFRRDRSEVEMKKFTVGLDELQLAVPGRAMQLDESVFYIEPAR